MPLASESVNPILDGMWFCLTSYPHPPPSSPGESHVEEVQVVRPLTLALECTWTGGHDRPDNISGFWRKDGSELADSRLPVLLENQQYNLRRV